MSVHVLRNRQNRLQQLRGFCLAAATGSFSAAASRMSLTQPAVSHQIKRLEADLNTPLFSRSPGKIRLTHDGHLLFQMARPLIDELESLETRFLQQRLDVEEGQIEIAAGPSTIVYLLPRHVETFRRAYPKIGVGLQQVRGAEALEKLRTGAVDMAVAPLLEVPDDLDFHPVITYEAVVITPYGHPLSRQSGLTLEAISHYPLILPPRNLTTATAIDNTFKQHGLSYKVALEVGGWEAIKTYVELGLGISIVINICITGHENLEVLPAGELFPGRTYGVVVLKRKILTPQARRFANLLISSSTLGAPIPSSKGLA